MTVDIEFSPKKASKKGNTLFIKGELTVANAGHIKESMMQGLKEYSLIHLKIDQVNRIDLSVLQLIYAFQQAARSGGKEVQLDINLPEELSLLVHQSGLGKIIDQAV